MKILGKIFISGTLILLTNLAFAKGMNIENPYVREVPPGQMTSASFLVITNANDKEISLIKAYSDVAKNVELHEHVHKDGMMEMRQVKEIKIPANGKTILKPGGYHIMLIGLTRKIKAGDIIDMELEFNNGDKQAIKAEVKKIMQGMMMGGMKMKKNAKMDAIQKHVNPMPNLMRVYKKMGDKLSLTKEQTAEFDAGIKERGPKVEALTKTIMKLEADLKEAILTDKPLSSVDQVADKLMQNRLAMIQGKTKCRETTKEILDEDQFNKLLELYRTKMMPKAMKMSEEQAEIAMKMHTNPMPNLMKVVKEMADKLNLTEKQAADLKQWQDERGPIMKKQMNDIMMFEKSLSKATLNNEPLEKINQLADSVLQVRMKVVRGKAFCRDNMKRILDDEQYKKVLELYKANFSS